LSFCENVSSEENENTAARAQKELLTNSWVTCFLKKRLSMIIRVAVRCVAPLPLNGTCTVLNAPPTCLADIPKSWKDATAETMHVSTKARVPGRVFGSVSDDEPAMLADPVVYLERLRFRSASTDQKRHAADREIDALQ
jgi:hypothetical protein